MERIIRRETRAVRVGPVTIGGGAPIIIQSMTNTQTTDLEATGEQISRLAEAGCELVRVAVTDKAAADAFAMLTKGSPVPLIADIHFDARPAHLAIEGGAAKIRINPGNIGGRDKLLALARHAEEYKVPIRVGVNAGSLNRKLLNKYGGATAAALVESALGYLEILEEAGFDNVVVSLKASDVYTTISAYRLFAEKRPYPLHLGVTGAGPLEAGLVKGAIGIGTLLAEGIGDTVRVSLTASPLEEIKIAKMILQSLNIRRFAPELISCPTCGRCEIDLITLAGKVEKMLKSCSLPLKIAVMGCVVNGPGEARDADLGISAGKKHGIIFRHGEVIRTVPLDNLLEELRYELEQVVKEFQAKEGREICEGSGNSTGL